MEIKGTKTEKNLWEAFAGESQARNKYSFYASKAKKDGYEQIAAIFEETANNEKEHAKIWFKILNGGEIKETYSNLLDAAAGEKSEYTEMYARMAKEAKEEGFDKYAELFEGIAKIENEHEKRFLAFAKAVKESKLFKADKIVTWKCRNCGHLHVGNSAPEICPVCDHPQAYFEIENNKY
ncbi:MAG: rubrerythrin family protein [Clostridia bacterium]|nr:rubrerythrin family protein [Clostridia bacterium]MDD4686051.1 rubrerythrin family protein [Clostridia bacterium]